MSTWNKEALVSFLRDVTANKETKSSLLLNEENSLFLFLPMEPFFSPFLSCVFYTLCSANILATSMRYVQPMELLQYDGE